MEGRLGHAGGLDLLRGYRREPGQLLRCAKGGLQSRILATANAEEDGRGEWGETISFSEASKSPHVWLAASTNQSDIMLTWGGRGVLF